jgi:hypothetical protein
VSTAILVLLIFAGARAAHPLSPPRVQMSQMNASAMVMPAFGEESSPNEAAYEERELVQRLDHLARALNAFAASYKNGQVDLNKAKAVRKALQELEKFEWFKPQKEK